MNHNRAEVNEPTTISRDVDRQTPLAAAAFPKTIPPIQSSMESWVVPSHLCHSSALQSDIFSPELNITNYLSHKYSMSTTKFISKTPWLYTPSRLPPLLTLLLSPCISREKVQHFPSFFSPLPERSPSLNSIISSDVTHLLRPFPLHLCSALIFSHLDYCQGLQASLVVLGFSLLNIPSTPWLLEWSS